MTNLQEQLRKARQCSIPLVNVRSVDAVSTLATIRQSLNGKSDRIAMLEWNVLTGITGINELGKAVAADILGGQDAAMVSARPTDCLGMAVGLPEDCMLFMHNLHLYWNDAPVLQAVLNLRDRFKASGSMLLALTLTGSVLPPELTEHILVLEDILPTSAELETIAREIFQSAEVPAPDAETLAKVADATLGLSRFAAEQSISLNMSKAGIELPGVWARKRKMIESDGLLKCYVGPESFDNLGGNEGFKSYNSALFAGKEAPKAAVLMDEIEKAIAQDSGNSTKTELIGLLLSWFQDKEVDGILLNGVPGAGKTAGVKALGNQFGVPVILFNVATMQNQYVGNSAKRLITALDRIDAMCNGKPCVYATCNKLETLSAEFRSRFKLGTFFFDLPTSSERSSIWRIYREKYEIEDNDIPACDGWTGREIRECCYKAYRLGITLVESARYIVPVSKSSAEVIKALRLQASGKFLSANDNGIYRFEETAPAPSGRKFRGEN